MSSLSDNFDYIIVNLKVFAHVRENQRISTTSKGYFEIEKEYIWQSLKRFLYGESREKLIRDINVLISKTIVQVRTLLTSSLLTESGESIESENKRLLLNKISNLYRELERSLSGFENLKSTYANDKRTGAELEVIIDKIVSMIKEIEVKIPRISEVAFPFIVDKVN